MNHRFSFRNILATALLGCLAVMLLSAASSRADEPSAKRRRMENRFLFVIDTSSAMKARATGVDEAVNGLLESGMKGELRKGDTIGLWTYSDRLDTDFPMEVWSEDKKDDILKEVAEHLRHLRYEKRPHLNKALPAIMQVVGNSERVTIILIFDGSDPIKGTLFDKDINGLHKHYAAEFRSAHAPFVTLLAARKGAVFDYTINYPGTVMVPHTADPLPPPETNAPQNLVESAPTSAETNAPPEEPAAPRPPNVQINLSGADFVHPPNAPPPAAIQAAVVANPAPAPAPAFVASAPPPSTVATVSAQSAPTKVAPPEPEHARPPVASTPPPAPVVTPPSKPAPLAPAVVAATTGQLTAMFIMAFSLLTIAVVLVLFLLRRWRGGPQPSLISQSIDRPR